MEIDFGVITNASTPYGLSFQAANITQAAGWCADAVVESNVQWEILNLSTSKAVCNSANILYWTPDLRQLGKRRKIIWL